MTRSRARIVIALAAALTLLLGAPAVAEPSDQQRQVDAYLAANPGGVQIGPNDIAYGGGAFIVSVTRPANVRAVADCTSGWFCFYDRVNFGYPRGRLSDCGWQDLGTYGWQNRVESIHYNMSSGSVSFIKHGAAGDHSKDTTVAWASSSVRTRADIAPHRNVADHVYRYC